MYYLSQNWKIWFQNKCYTKSNTKIYELYNYLKNLGRNEFYHLSQEFNANVLDLLKKKGFFFSITTGVTLKNLKKVYLAKISFIKH